MNERIRELAEQAGFSFKYKTAPDELNPGHRLQDLEKFAELIVDKCAEIAWRNTPDYEELEYSHLISNKIKEYFGVEDGECKTG